MSMMTSALETLRKELGEESVRIEQRYKGLGEMNNEQLWETTMNPENRTILQVNIEDAAEADRTFDMLMGSKCRPAAALSRPTPTRRGWIFDLFRHMTAADAVVIWRSTSVDLASPRRTTWKSSLLILPIPLRNG